MTAAELTDFTVTRSITPSGGTLSFTSKDGMKFQSPQEALDRLVGRISFDPFAFRIAGATDKQVATLKKLSGGP